MFTQVGNCAAGKTQKGRKRKKKERRCKLTFYLCMICAPVRSTVFTLKCTQSNAVHASSERREMASGQLISE